MQKMYRYTRQNTKENNKFITGLRDFRYEERLKEYGLTTLGTHRWGGSYRSL